MSLYSTIAGRPQAESQMPSFSSGIVRASSLSDISPSAFAVKPMNAGSTTRTRGLSTWKYEMTSMPRSSSQASVPESASAFNDPPCPLGLMKMRPGSSRTSLPASSTAGICPWEKMRSSRAGRPKLSWAEKNSLVAASLVGLVITRSGISRPYRRDAARTFSTCILKSVRSVTGPIGKAPFGPSKPSLVPCPPATTIAATLPARRASTPASRAACHSRSAAASRGRRMKGSGSYSPAWQGRASASAVRRSMRSRSSVSIWSASARLAAPSSESQKARTCSCPWGLRVSSSRALRSSTSGYLRAYWAAMPSARRRRSSVLGWLRRNSKFFVLSPSTFASFAKKSAMPYGS